MTGIRDRVSREGLDGVLLFAARGSFPLAGHLAQDVYESEYEDDTDEAQQHDTEFHCLPPLGGRRNSYCRTDKYPCASAITGAMRPKARYARRTGALAPGKKLGLYRD